MKDHFLKIQQRTLQYWMVDGLSEMAFGFLCMLLAGYFYAQATLPTDTLAYAILNMSFVLLIIGGALLTNRIVVAIKSRITYPRTGYLAYKAPTRSRRWLHALVAFALAGTLSFLFSLALSGNPQAFDWMPMATGVIFGTALLISAWRTALLRFILQAAGSLIWGTVLSLLGIGDSLGLAYFYAGISLLAVISGGCTLINYLRHAPILNDENE